MKMWLDVKKGVKVLQLCDVLTDKVVAIKPVEVQILMRETVQCSKEQER